MKITKRIAAPMIAAVLCLLITISSVPIASALSTPKAPSKIMYRSDYAIDEHCLVISPKAISTGFQVQTINANGVRTYNKYFRCSSKTSFISLARSTLYGISIRTSPTASSIPLKSELLMLLTINRESRVPLNTAVGLQPMPQKQLKELKP